MPVLYAVALIGVGGFVDVSFTVSIVKLRSTTRPFCAARPTNALSFFSWRQRRAPVTSISVELGSCQLGNTRIPATFLVAKYCRSVFNVFVLRLSLQLDTSGIRRSPSEYEMKTKN